MKESAFEFEPATELRIKRYEDELIKSAENIAVQLFQIKSSIQAVEKSLAKGSDSNVAVDEWRRIQKVWHFMRFFFFQRLTCHCRSSRL